MRIFESRSKEVAGPRGIDPPPPAGSIGAVLTTVLGLALVSANGPIQTDRPGNGNAATVVPALRFQLETSWLATDDPDIEAAMSFPTVARFGLFGVAEIRLGSGIVGIWNAPEPSVDSGDDFRGVRTDTLVGSKVQLLESEGARPDLSVMVDVFLPTGEAPFTADVVVPELRVAGAWSLPAGFGLLLNAGFDVPRGARNTRYGQLIYVANLGYAIPVLESRFSVFVESFGRVSTASQLGASIHQFDTGLAVRVTDDVQLDSFVQVGLVEAAPDFQLSIGVSFRI